MSMCMAFWSTPDRAAGHSCERRDGHHGPHKCCCGRTREVTGLTPKLEEFYLTFGVQYEREVHPRGSWVHPDGYVVIEAADYGTARAAVVDLFGQWWSDLYTAERFASEPLTVRLADFYPRGELLRIVVPAGLVEQEDHRV